MPVQRRRFCATCCKRRNTSALEFVTEDRRLRLRDVYTLSFRRARDLHRRFPDARIMVGGGEGGHGLVQHHWIEIPSVQVYVDPACDVPDPFPPIRVGYFLTRFRIHVS